MLFHTTTVHIQEILDESRTKTILLDFYASWCAPCRKLASVLDTLTDHHELTMTSYSVNADTDPELVEMFDVSALPTVLFLKNGEVAAKLTNEITEELLETTIAQL